MKNSRSLLVVFLMLILFVLLIACNRKMQTAAVKAPAAAPAPTPASPQPETVPRVQEPAQVTLEMPTLSLKDAFFDFDKSLIREDAKMALKEDAKLLKERPDAKIQIEGHCDERGTDDYNLALGNRRAEAVKRYLISLGVDASRISTVSFGEEKPFCTEPNATCYQENRRGHFVIVSTGG